MLPNAPDLTPGHLFPPHCMHQSKAYNEIRDAAWGHLKALLQGTGAGALSAFTSSSVQLQGGLVKQLSSSAASPSEAPATASGDDSGSASGGGTECGVEVPTWLAALPAQSAVLARFGRRLGLLQLLAGPVEEVVGIARVSGTLVEGPAGAWRVHLRLGGGRGAPGVKAFGRGAGIGMVLPLPCPTANHGNGSCLVGCVPWRLCRGLAARV